MQNLIKPTLNFINHVRREVGDREPLAEIPKGSPDNVVRCPVARGVALWPHSVYASNDHVALTSIDEGVMTTREFAYPDEVLLFVRAFDRGDIPELLIDESVGA
jgi:hypothetical protein